MDFLVIFIPLLPIFSAVIIGMGFLSNVHVNDEREHKTSVIARGSIMLMCLLALALLVSDLLGKNSGFYSVGQWLNSDKLNIELNFITSGFSVILAALFSIILVIVTQFSTFTYIKNQDLYVIYLYSASFLRE